MPRDPRERMLPTVTRALLVFVSAAMAVVAFIAAIAVVFAGIDAYMVASERAMPGEPIFLDTLAQPLGDSLLNVAIGIAIIGFAAVVRAYIERRLRTPSDS